MAKVIKALECCATDECEVCPYEDQCFSEDIAVCSPMAKDALELVKSYDQILWERNIAIGQLRSIGKELGQTMDDVIVQEKFEEVLFDRVPLHN